MKKLLLPLFLVLLVILPVGCSMTNQSAATETSEPKATYLVTQSENEASRVVTNFKASAAEIEEKAKTATDETAADIKGEIEKLKTNLASFDTEIADAVKNSKISDEARKSYDTEVETIKTNLDELNKKLESQ